MEKSTSVNVATGVATNVEPLREVTAHKEPLRRWFRNTKFDLTVIMTKSGEILTFQLDYRENQKDYSLYWNGFRLRDFMIDEGDDDPSANRSPIVFSEREHRTVQLAEQFAKISTDIDPVVREFILEKLKVEA